MQGVSFLLENPNFSKVPLRARSGLPYQLVPGQVAGRVLQTSAPWLFLTVDLSHLIKWKSFSNTTFWLPSWFIQLYPSKKGGQILTESVSITILPWEVRRFSKSVSSWIQRGSLRLRQHLKCLTSVYKSSNLLNWRSDMAQEDREKTSPLDP